MNSTAPPPRRFRLQISLRMLLLLMAVCGMAIGFYRWPWVETKEYEVSTALTPHRTRKYERQTTYRRDWRGNPVKHGRERMLSDGVLLHEAHFYDGVLDGPRRAFDAQGRILMETHYRGGSEHGPFRVGDGQQTLWEGSCFQRELHGSCKSLTPRRDRNLSPPHLDQYFLPDGELRSAAPQFDIPADAIVVHHHWNHGKRNGEWTWQTRSGEVLNRGTYQDDELIEWNGQPLVEQFWNWLRSPAVNDPALIAALQAAKKGKWVEFNSAHQGILYFGVKVDNDWEPKIAVRLPEKESPRTPEDWFHPHGGGSFAAGLCAMAAYNGYKFDYRYGTLWLVPAADPEPPWVDPTGVEQIKFDPGSTQEREWNEIVAMQQWKPNEHSVKRLLEGTSITRWNPRSETLSDISFGSQFELLQFSKRRRDILGMALYDADMRCRKIGNSLKFGMQRREWKARPYAEISDLLRDDF